MAITEEVRTLNYNPYQPYQPVYPAPPPPPKPYHPANGCAIAGMIVGIGCIIFCFAGVFELMGIIIAFVLSLVGISAANRGAQNKGMAVAGLVCSLVGLGFYLIVGASSFGIGFLI